MKRLKETNCIFALIGLESWADYSKKAGVGSSIGEKKLEKVIAHLKELRRYVQAFQVTLLFGTDMDKGDEPVELTKKFIRRVPFVWPVINIPIPFGCTPLFDSYLADGRILRSMPFSFYSSPYLTTILKNYHPLEYYQNWIEINKVAASPKLLIQRISSSENRLQKFLLILRTLSVGEQLLQLRRLRKLLITDKEFRAFHEGRTNELPEFYRILYRKNLGRYEKLISEDEMIPELEH
jgi:hypothetical protein